MQGNKSQLRIACTELSITAAFFISPSPYIFLLPAVAFSPPRPQELEQRSGAKNIPYFEVSAKDGTNLEQAFTRIAKEALMRNINDTAHLNCTQISSSLPDSQDGSMNTIIITAFL